MQEWGGRGVSGPYANLTVSLPAHLGAPRQMAQKRVWLWVEVVRSMYYRHWLGAFSERSMTLATTALCSHWLGATQEKHKVGSKAEADPKRANSWRGQLTPLLAAGRQVLS